MRIAAETLLPEGRRQIDAALAFVKRIAQARSAIRADRMLTAAEVDKLTWRLSERGKLFVRFLYATGCRVSELTGIRLTDCRINGGVTLEVIGKGEKARKIRITPKLFNQIRRTFKGKTWLFETENGTPYNRSYISHMIERQSKQDRARRPRVAAFCCHGFDRKDREGSGSEYVDPATTLRFYVHESLTDDEFEGAETRGELICRNRDLTCQTENHDSF